MNLPILGGTCTCRFFRRLDDQGTLTKLRSTFIDDFDEPSKYFLYHTISKSTWCGYHIYINGARIHKQKLPLSPHFMLQDIKCPENMIMAQHIAY
jgi:hypothetical protein